ncbi:protein prenylyltransferase [Piromyces finnis]|uniref:Protein prenylyltransferase n=1 Tax=Piromyces finnis TaxID=1754191 RepID=A0A1Y1V1C7_9FUNG|nr:protein prenylyltransferase [Piromyces finnis]|eukprot:ORX43818.1 protein prenylyltransferase [Piromyces finnis]
MDAETIYITLKKIITTENLIEESFVPKEGDGTYKPFVFIENCLGIPFPIVPKILEFLKKKFVELRKKKNYEEIDYCTQCILLINGEYITAWNERKKLIKLGYIKPEYDLSLTKLCLTKHPKSSHLWYHRQWILKNYPPLINYNNEFIIIDNAVNRYSTNYFSWNHRIFLLDYMDKENLIEELKAFQNKIYKHISDHAGWNYLLIILKKLVIYPSSNKNTYKKEIQQLLSEHIEFVKKQLMDFPGHETIWYYQRLLSGFIYQNKEILYEHCEKEIQSFYDKEIEFLNKTYLNENNSNAMIIEEKLALQYKLWLFIHHHKNTAKPNYSTLKTEIENYQMMSDDKSINYLLDIISNIQNFKINV